MISIDGSFLRQYGRQLGQQNNFNEIGADERRKLRRLVDGSKPTGVDVIVARKIAIMRPNCSHAAAPLFGVQHKTLRTAYEELIAKQHAQTRERSTHRRLRDT